MASCQLKYLTCYTLANHRAWSSMNLLSRTKSSLTNTTETIYRLKHSTEIELEVRGVATQGSTRNVPKN